MKPNLTVFTPAYNEIDNLTHCVEVVLSKMDELGVAAELLIVEDGSQDGTARLADELANRFPQVRVVHHPHNLGIGAAFRTAMSEAAGEWMIQVHADLPLHPDELHRFIDAAPGADIVVGLRSDRSDYTLLRMLVSFTNIYLIRTLFGMKLRQFQYISMYRLDVLRQIDIEYWRSAFFLAEILIKARDLGKRLVEVEILYAPRVSGSPTGAKLKLIIDTVFDLFHYWLRWKFTLQRHTERHELI